MNTRHLLASIVLTINCGDGGKAANPDAALSSDSATPDAQSIDAGPPVELLGAPIEFGFSGPIYAAIHAGDAWYIGGGFKRAETIVASMAIGLDLNGAPSITCLSKQAFNGRVNQFVQLDNSLYAVGPFTTYNGQSANRIAKLDATTCELDISFSPPAGNGFDYDVRTIIASADGASLFVGGLFSSYRGVSSNSRYLVKIDALTGVRDTQFLQTPDNPVLALAVDNNTLYVGGTFTRWNGVNNSANKLAKVNASDGTQDTAFSPNDTNVPGCVNIPTCPQNGFRSGNVRALVVDGNDLYVGGNFTRYRGIENSANNFVKLNKTTGSPDTDFSPVGPTSNGFNGLGGVHSLAITPTSIYAGGEFTAYRGVANSAFNLAKLDKTTGVLDTTFSPVAANGSNFGIYTLATSGQALFAGGLFTSYRGSRVNGIAKINALSGARLPFGPADDDASGFVRKNSNRAQVGAVYIHGDNVWVGGEFDFYAGKLVNGLVRLPDLSGKVDRVFSPVGSSGFDREVTALAANGESLFVGGGFATYRGVVDSAMGLAKLNLTTGALDTTFSPPATNGFDGDVYALLIEGASVFVGGGFSAYRGVVNSASNIAKLDIDTGTLDPIFGPTGDRTNGFDNDIYALAVIGDSLFVGGDIQDYQDNENSTQSIAKVNKNTGALDTSFSPAANNGFDGTVYALVADESAVYVGGDFTQYRGDTYNRIIKLSGATGVADSAFGDTGEDHGFDAEIGALALKEGELFVAGGFTAYRSVPSSASYIAKLDASSGDLDTVFTPTGAVATYTSFFSAAATYGPSVLFGGNFSLCSSEQCFVGGIRVNRSTREPE